MTDRRTLHRLIEELPDSQLVAAENSLTYYLQEEVLQTLTRLGGPPLYDTDFYAWTQAQAAALRAKDWTALDLEHVAEEIESMGKRDRRAVECYLEVRLRHGLKWVYQPERRSGSWRRTLTVSRQRLARLLRDHHTLRAELAELLPSAYADARELAAAETSLPLATFPEACPWRPEQVLAADFPPEA
jgi:hypothetical protein